MKSKAAVAKALKDKGIPLPKKDSYDAMMHMVASVLASRYSIQSRQQQQ